MLSCVYPSADFLRSNEGELSELSPLPDLRGIPNIGQNSGTVITVLVRLYGSPSCFARLQASLRSLVAADLALYDCVIQ